MIKNINLNKPLKGSSLQKEILLKGNITLSTKTKRSA